MKDILISIVDNNPVFLASMERLFDGYSDISIAFLAEDGIDFFIKLAQTKKHPSIVLMDLSMPNMNGIDATKRIKEHFPGIKVVIMTMYDHEEYVMEMIEHGADGYLLKDNSFEQIVEAIKSVNSGNKLYCVDVLTKVSERFSAISKTKVFTSLNYLNISNREHEILKLLCKAKTAKEIANELSISERTVETHRNTIIKKTGARNLIDLVVKTIYSESINENTMPLKKDPFHELDGNE